MPLRMPPLTVAVVPWTYALCVAVLCGLAVAAALFPARRAARMKLPDALGHT